MSETTAVIADDEKLSQEHIRLQLKNAWPECIVSGLASNGLEALELIETIHPDIAFLDIKMPGMSGIQVAQNITHACQVVFITAYDQYAVTAFESEAIDYIIKPLTTERLIKTIERIKARLNRELIQENLPGIYERIWSNLPGNLAPRYLTWIKALVKGAVRLIPVDQVCYFQSSHKYTMVITRDMEVLIRKSISQLASELNPDMFFQVHRATIVNAAFIEKVSTSPTNRGLIKLKGRPEIITVSRTFTPVFKQM